MKQRLGIFVNNDGPIAWATLLVFGLKTIETRSRNMLGKLVGQRVAIIATSRKHPPVILGHVTITEAFYCNAGDFPNYYEQHRVPEGSAFSPKAGKGKWCYVCKDAKPDGIKYLPKNAIRHGLSWCEWIEED